MAVDLDAVPMTKDFVRDRSDEMKRAWATRRSRSAGLDRYVQGTKRRCGELHGRCRSPGAPWFTSAMGEPSQPAAGRRVCAAVQALVDKRASVSVSPSARTGTCSPGRRGKSHGGWFILTRTRASGRNERDRRWRMSFARRFTGRWPSTCRARFAKCIQVLPPLRVIAIRW